MKIMNYYKNKVVNKIIQAEYDSRGQFLKDYYKENIPTEEVEELASDVSILISYIFS